MKQEHKAEDTCLAQLGAHGGVVYTEGGTEVVECQLDTV